MKVLMHVVVVDDKEMYDRDIQSDQIMDQADQMGIAMDVPFYNEHDELYPMVVDLLEITTFYRRDIYWNDQKLEGISARTIYPPHYLPTIVCSFDDFLKLYAAAHNTEILRKEEILQRINSLTL